MADDSVSIRHGKLLYSRIRGEQGSCREEAECFSSFDMAEANDDDDNGAQRVLRSVAS